jgi:3'(2'), 5'-bisphosphate nucleotidase
LGVVCSRSHLNQETQDFIDKLSNPTKVSTGSSLKFLILAEGGAHVYPRIAPTMEWDTAAAQMILEAAGGKVISNETGEPLLYNKENLLNPYFVAYGNLK